ncbi:hypothetical protein CTEN210_14145 [Chaetoceros tenuissimus]|uniref:Uncharacterized protein n=1 Tax=Chaetoceros tenuissimus TaxID=426638 RepID=A0AAD3D4M0_9STRA|nr:hypothetical protein CTEN210_14145 [Chaetoceros tenuissimus]
MGNICCGESEEQKPSALTSIHEKGNILTDQTNLPNSIAPPPPSGNAVANNISNVPSDSSQLEADKLRLEEQQKALHEEQERLARIVNDAGHDMVSVNGGVSGNLSGRNSIALGGQNPNMGGMYGASRGVGYYDQNYATEVWQDLIPSRNNTGGLVARCEQEEENMKASGLISEHPFQLNQTPTGGLDSDESVLEALLGNGLNVERHYSLLWSEESVKQLNELITDGQDGDNGDNLLLQANESMDLLMDSLAEKFLAKIFQENIFQSSPIVENVL